VLELWTSIAERNEYPPPSRAAEAGMDGEMDVLLERLVGRLGPDLPGPLPASLFDPGSARAVARVVHAALGRLHPGSASGRDLLPSMAAVPAPRTAAAQVTQAALGWFAVPLARRLESEAFRAANRGERDAEGREAAGESLIAFLAKRPLLSLREDTEEMFGRSGVPGLDAIEETTGLRRWLVQRLASPGGVPSRRAAVIERIERSWARPSAALREVLFLRARSGGDGAEDPLLPSFVPLLVRGEWPEDLAPAMRRRALELRSQPPKENDEPPGPDA
jgi:hypothetical protein